MYWDYACRKEQLAAKFGDKTANKIKNIAGDGKLYLVIKCKRVKMKKKSGFWEHSKSYIILTDEAPHFYSEGGLIKSSNLRTGDYNNWNKIFLKTKGAIPLSSGIKRIILDTTYGKIIIRPKGNTVNQLINLKAAIELQEVFKNQNGVKEFLEVNPGISKTRFSADNLDKGSETFEALEKIWLRPAPTELERDRKIVLKESIEFILKGFKESEVSFTWRGYLDKKEKHIHKFYNENKEEIESFLTKHGSGNPETTRKLTKVLEEKHNREISVKDVQIAIDSKWRERKRDKLEKTLGSHSPTEKYEYISAFIDEFGKGNKESRQLLAELIDQSYAVTDERVREEFKQVQTNEEVEKFKKGLDIGNGSSTDSLEKDLLEDLNQSDFNWQNIRSMEGLEFEEFLGKIFSKKGYEVEVTSGSNDQGADLILDQGYRKIVVQAKRYRNNVNNSAVQEVVAAKEHYNADKAIVVTTSEFTSSARDLAESNNVVLWDKERLKQELKKSA